MNATKPVAVIHFDKHEFRAPRIAVTAALDGVACYFVNAPATSKLDELGAIVEAFRYLWRRERGGMILYVGHPVIRELLDDLSSHYPGLEIRSLVTGENMRRTWDACRRAHSRNVGVKEKPKAERTEHRVAATDASKKKTDNTVGIAVVSSDGSVKMGNVDARTVLDGEFAAIRLAVKQAVESKTVRSIEILTDSLTAATAINTRGHAVNQGAGRHEASCCSELRNAAALGIDVRVTWVRGHAGHPLNELAHRAAMASRRCRQWGQSSEQFRRSLTAELREVLAAAGETVQTSGLSSDRYCA